MTVRARAERHLARRRGAVHGRRPDREPVAVLADARPLDGERGERAVGREPRVVRDGEAVEVVRARGSRQGDPPGGAGYRASRARVMAPAGAGFQSIPGRGATIDPAMAAEQLSFRLDPALPIPGDLAPMWPVPRPDAFDSPDFLFEPTWGGHRVFAFVGPAATPGTGRRADRRPVRPRPGAAAPGARRARRPCRTPARRSSTASSSWSTASGRADDEGLRDRLNGRPGRPVALLVFDVLHLDGVWLLADAAREAAGAAQARSCARATRSSSCRRSPARAARSTTRSRRRASRACSRGVGRRPTCPGSAAGCGARSSRTPAGQATAPAMPPRAGPMRREPAPPSRATGRGPRPVPDALAVRATTRPRRRSRLSPGSPARTAGPSAAARTGARPRGRRGSRAASRAAP